MKRRVLTLATVAGVALGGVLTSIPATAQSAQPPAASSAAAQRSSNDSFNDSFNDYVPPPVAFGACASTRLQAAGAQCAMVTVPLDYADPTGPTVKIAISRVKHKVPDSQYQGIMLVNPGGPGGSGLGLSTLGSAIPKGAGSYYDWIGFDPRGVGSSEPHVSCQTDYFAGPRPEYIPKNEHLEKVWLARSKNYTRACAQKNGAILDHMTTQDVATDMDSIRAALGEKQINYYGFSYGTYLAQVYSTLFPSHVRRMVMDSTVDPRGVWYEDNLDQDVAFQKTEDIWFGWLAKYDSYYHLGKTQADVKALWYKIKQQLTKNPAGGVVGPDEWTDIFLQAGYYQIVWLELGDVFAKWANNHDLATLTQAYEDYVGPDDDNGFAVYAGVQCTDVQWPTDWNKWATDNWRTYAKAPFETWANAWFNAPCLTWPAKAHTPVQIDGSKVKSVLMIDETLDAATPYPGSLYVRSLYPGARLIAEPGGTTHAGTLYGNECVDGQIADYLAAGTLPARAPGNGPDATCKPLPRPDPTAQASAASAAATPAATQAATELSRQTRVRALQLEH